ARVGRHHPRPSVRYARAPGAERGHGAGLHALRALRRHRALRAARQGPAPGAHRPGVAGLSPRSRHPSFLRPSRPALPSLPAALDALVTGLAFLLLARLALERSAEAGGLPRLLGHPARLLLAAAGIVHGW